MIILRTFADFLSTLVSNFFSKNKNLVLLHGSTISKYNESTRYLFEYFQKNSTLKAVWMTDSKKVYNHLSDSNMPVVMHRSFKGACYYIRAGVVVGNGTSYPTLLGFTGKKTIKVCLHHGMGPRSTNSADQKRIKNTNKIINSYSKFDYFNSTSQFTNNAVASLQFQIPKDKRIVFGLPRCDHLLNLKLTRDLKIQKPILNSQNFLSDKKSKCILYSPTWRPIDNNLTFPLNQIEGFELKLFNNWLKDNNFIFLISIHPLMKDLEDFSDFSNISYLKNNPILDINQILPEIDLLLTDYSSIATDFMLMNRPVIYVMPDYEFYLNEFGLLEDFRECLPGYEAKNLNQLFKFILNSFQNPDDMKAQRAGYLKKYYDVENNKSCERLCNFIEELVS